MAELERVEKMTDKEKDIYDICLEKKSLYCIRRMGEETCGKCKTYKMYELGLAEGKPKWHDLRKNPNDLPTETGEYRVYIYDSGIKKNRTVNLDFLGCSWVALIDVIAWCELPKFEE